MGRFTKPPKPPRSEEKDSAPDDLKPVFVKDVEKVSVDKKGEVHRKMVQATVFENYTVRAVPRSVLSNAHFSRLRNSSLRIDGTYIHPNDLLIRHPLVRRLGGEPGEDPSSGEGAPAAPTGVEGVRMVMTLRSTLLIKEPRSGREITSSVKDLLRSSSGRQVVEAVLGRGDVVANKSLGASLRRR